MTDFHMRDAVKIIKDEQCPKCNHKMGFIDSDGVEWEHGRAPTAVQLMK